MNLNFKYIIACALSLVTMGSAHAVNQTIALSEVAHALSISTAGDTIRIANGTYKDVELKWQSTGTAVKPIVVMAETAGKVKIEGLSSLKFAGEWLEIHGLYFTNGEAANGSVIEYRLGKDVANNCRVTNCVVDSFNPKMRDIAYSYVLMYGKNNRFDHNSLQGKLNISVTLIVMLNEERSQQNFHRIDHNYFGLREVFGSNGAETIRVGTSQQAHTSSNTIIEDNLFEQCNGEVEIVSIKSSDNIVRHNTFLECQGVVALRHGDRNTVIDNLFIGNGVQNTGGVRVVNAGHKVLNNTFISLAGYRFFSALALMNAVPNSLPNRYCLVEDIEIKGNTFYNCSNIEFGTGKDLERTLPPTRITFEQNTIINKELSSAYIAIDDISGYKFADNKAELKVKTNATGFSNATNLPTPKATVEREGRGAAWFSNTINKGAKNAEQGKVIKIAPGSDTFSAAVSNASPGDIIELSQSGDYPITYAATVRVPLTIRAAKELATKPVVRFNGTKKHNMVTIDNGGELTVSGIAFSGALEDGKGLASAGISTSNGMIKPYNLTVDNCEFFDFGESGFFAIRGMKNTFALNITIKNSLFHSLSGDAINFAAEKDDAGKYNAENFLIANCAFNRILGLAVNIYRGGSDESTAGPFVEIKNCNFDDVCNKERGSVMRLIGPQVMNISGCNFADSGRGGAAIRLDEATWEKINIRDCNFWNSGRIITMTDNVVKGEIFKLKPQYTDAAKFDYRQTAQSPLKKLEIKGINIGIK